MTYHTLFLELFVLPIGHCYSVDYVCNKINLRIAVLPYSVYVCCHCVLSLDSVILV